MDSLDTARKAADKANATDRATLLVLADIAQSLRILAGRETPVNDHEPVWLDGRWV